MLLTVPLGVRLAGAGLSRRPPGSSSPAASIGDFGTTASSNWSGYAAVGATFDNVVGNWTEPTVSCSRGAQYASTWVGMDGYVPGDKGQVEQAGTDSDCVKVRTKVKGHKATITFEPLYFAWWEMYPSKVVVLPASSCPVAAGDAMTADVSDSSGAFTLTVSDATQGWQCASEPQSSSAPAVSAEWVVEAPFSLTTGQVLKLADFGTVGFSGAQANGTPIASLFNDAVTMRTGKVVKASTSPLGSDGESFTVTWQHA